MDDFWKEKNVAVTGAFGFLGKHLIQELSAKKPKSIFMTRYPEYDFTKMEDCRKLMEKRPDIIIHLAAKVGGIGLNLERPGELFYENLMMGVQLIESARIAKIKKFVAIGTICGYPKYAKIPFKENDLWDGYPDETNAPYGLAKKMLLVQSQAYRKQYGFNSIFLLPVNLYGPGDNFNLDSSHVIPAIIKKMFDAIKDERREVILWGSGEASREFLFVKDCAKAIVLASERYDKSDPVNLGAGFEIKIKDLAEKIKIKTGFSGNIIWDKTKPDGQPRRSLDTTRATKEFGFVAETQFDLGLAETIKWYKNTN